MKFATIIQLLAAWGYLDNAGLVKLLWNIWKEHGPEFREAVRRFKERWGAKYNLPGEARLDDPTLALMARRFCHVADDVQAVGEGYRRWGGNTITWRDAGVRVGSLSFPAAMDFTIAQVAAACNLAITKASGNANIVSQAARIDGPGNTLAYAYLPGSPSPLTASLGQTYDVSEAALTQHAFNLVALHETGHSCGLDHDNTSEVCLMDPYLNADLAGLQPGDVRQFVLRYGPPPTVPSPPGSPVETRIIRVSGRDLHIEVA